MEYLRSAASAVLSKSSGPFPNFTLGAALSTPGSRGNGSSNSGSGSDSIWSIYQGTKKDDGSACTIFVFDIASNSNPHQTKNHLLLAKNALRKLRTLRHPDVLKLLDSNETATGVYIAVEPVRLLDTVLSEWKEAGGTEESKKEWIAWGLSKVANALKFINIDASSVHGNIRPASIFLSQGGDWRLGGFELLTAKGDYEGVIWSHGGLLTEASKWAPTEVRQNGWSSLREQEPFTFDSYSFALLTFAVYNGLAPSGNVSLPPQGFVPAPLFASVRRMMVPTAKTRMSVAQLVETASAPGGMWKENRLNKLSEGCENFMLASDRERTELVRSLQNSTASLPSDFLTYRVLPSLVNALNLASQQSANPQGLAAPHSIHATSILPLVLQLGAPLPDAKWQDSVLAPILKAYSSPDRSVRMMLLEQLPSYVDRIPSRKIADNVWPNLITGFADSSAAIREATLRSILPLSPKLTDRLRNNDLLRQLAKTQVDVEAGIRTNTTILLGRLAPTLNLNTRKSVLIPAFSRSLKDPFVHARVAGLMALMATSDSYDKDDLARSVLPAISPNLVDKEKLVRDQAEKALEVFWAKIRDEVKIMPETALPPEGDAQASSTFTSLSSSSNDVGFSSSGGAPGGLVSTAGGAATALAGWAMSGAMTYLASDTSKPVSSASGGDLDNQRPTLLTNESSGQNTPRNGDLSRSNNPLPELVDLSGSAARSSASTVHRDLIDILDDTDDWSSFETAPVKKPIRRAIPGGTTSTRGSRMHATSSLLGVHPSAMSRRELSSTAHSKLQIRGPSAGTDAWAQEGEDEPWDGDGGARQSASSSKAPTLADKSAAAAFNTPVPGWGTPVSEAPPNLSTRSGSRATSSSSTAVVAASEADNAAASWSAFPDEEGEGVPSTTGADATGTSLSKNEKRAQMERQREERRERMRKLKESKGKKLGDSLA